MQNQQKLIYLYTNDLEDLIHYLKDYSSILGKSYHYAKDIITQHEIASMNFNINKMIKKLKIELERK